jgi:hypothetical protein
MASISGISGSITILKIFYFTLEQSIIVGYVNQPVYMYFILPHGLSDFWLHFSLNINSNSKKIIIPKKNMFIPIPHPFPFLFFSSSSMSLSSIQSPFRLHISPRPFVSLSLISLHPFHMCSIVSFLSRSISCTFFPLLPSKICFLSSRSHIWISPSFVSLFSLTPVLFLRRYSEISFLILLVVSWIHWFCLFFLACSCLCSFHSALHSCLFLLLSMFYYPLLW